MTQLDILAAQALNDPSRNLYGHHGTRCPACSGLGAVLRTPVHGAHATRHTSTCSCYGTGIDREAMLRQQIDSFVDRMEAMERNQIAQAKRIAQLQKRARRDPKMSRQSWSEMIAWATADGTAVANTTTETIVMPNVTIPAGYMQDGRNLSGYCSGKLSTTATPTMTWAIRWGGVSGTLLATTEAITMGSGVTNVNWSCTFTVQTRSNGSTGTLLVFGELMVHTAAGTVLSNIFSVSGYDAPAAVTCDLTTDTALSVTADWSAASASNTLTGMIYTLKSEQ